MCADFVVAGTAKDFICRWSMGGDCWKLRYLYLGGDIASIYEYVSKLHGKWTIDKRTSGESKGFSGSYSKNYDVLGRELMLEYEIRLLLDDECIIFVRGENPIRDKKWFPWGHEEYLETRKCGVFVPLEQKRIQEK